MLVYAVFFWMMLMLIVSVHEFSHGWVAHKRGDDTALRAGRLTLNPLAHIDLFGSIIMPAILFFTTGFFFGMAKPVPVNFAALKKPKRDMILVGAAGPLSNFLMAIFAALLIHLFGISQESVLGMAARSFVFVNIILGVFNLIPIPPLDGSRVLMGLLPRAQAMAVARLEPYGFFIVIALFFLQVLNPIVFFGLNFFWRLLGLESAWLGQFF